MRLGAIALIAGFITYTLATGFWTLALVMPLVPIGTALLFPTTTALTSRWVEKSELGTTMGTAQTFAGMSRTIAPLIATTLFQRVSPAMPLYVGASYIVVVLFLSLRVQDGGASKEVDDEPKSGTLREETAESG